jgi:hypothetical protein
MVVHGDLQGRVTFLVCNSLKHSLERIEAFFVVLCFLIPDTVGSRTNCYTDTSADIRSA